MQILLNNKITQSAIDKLSRCLTTRVVAYTDASVGADPHNFAGIGVVLDLGNYIIEMSAPIRYCVSSLAELKAIEAAIDAVPAGRSLVINTDSLNTVRILSGQYRFRRHIREMWRVKNKLSARGNTTVSYWPRKLGAHRIADALARQAMFSGTRRTTVRDNK